MVLFPKPRESVPDPPHDSFPIPRGSVPVPTPLFLIPRNRNGDFGELVFPIPRQDMTRAPARVPDPPMSFWLSSGKRTFPIPRSSRVHAGRPPQRKVCAGMVRKSGPPAGDTRSYSPDAEQGPIVRGHPPCVPIPPTQAGIPRRTAEPKGGVCTVRPPKEAGWGWQRRVSGQEGTS